VAKGRYSGDARPPNRGGALAAPPRCVPVIGAGAMPVGERDEIEMARHQPEGRYSTRADSRRRRAQFAPGDALPPGVSACFAGRPGSAGVARASSAIPRARNKFVAVTMLVQTISLDNSDAISGPGHSRKRFGTDRGAPCASFFFTVTSADRIGMIGEKELASRRDEMVVASR